MAIRSGQLKPGQRLGSAKQLAKHWNASYGAVRQSLEALAAKGIVERRPRAGTFVSSSAQGLQTSPLEHGGIIGLLVPDIRRPEYGLIARHLQDAGHRAGVEILVSSTDNERERYDQSVMRHLHAGVAGLVLVSPRQARISLQTLVEIEKSGVPVVNYAHSIDLAAWPTVKTDVVKLVYVAVDHACKLGRKRIGFLTYSGGASYNTELQYGLYRALADNGLSSINVVEYPLSDSLYINGWADRQALKQRISEWLDQHPDVDAVCCTHDHIGAAVLSVLNGRGVRVPDDIAVIGSGNMPEFFGLPPGELTTVDTRIDKAMEEIVRLLRTAKVTESQDKVKPQTVVAIEPKLVPGRSSLGNSYESPSQPQAQQQ